jgi:hypothetical protein
MAFDGFIRLPDWCEYWSGWSNEKLLICTYLDLGSFTEITENPADWIRCLAVSTEILLEIQANILGKLPFWSSSRYPQKKWPVIHDFLRSAVILIRSYCQNKPELRRFHDEPNVSPYVPDPKNPDPPNPRFFPFPVPYTPGNKKGVSPPK